MNPKEKRGAALDYAKGINSSRSIEGDAIEIADHWLAGYRAGYKDRTEEFARAYQSRIGYGHTGPCNTGCDCDVARFSKTALETRKDG